MRQQVLGAMLAMAMIGPVAAAEICDDLDAVAGGWKAVAETVDANRDAEWSEQDVADLIETMTALHEGSSAFAELMKEAGTPDQKAIGTRLANAMANVAALTLESPVDEIVAASDEATNAMIEVTADCDAHHGQ